MLVAFGLISTYLELALKYLHVVQMGMVQLLCGTVPLVSKQWGLVPNVQKILTFPITFSSENYVVVASPSDKSGNSGGVSLIAETIDNKSCNLYLRFSNASMLVEGWNERYVTKPRWLALGA